MLERLREILKKEGVSGFFTRTVRRIGRALLIVCGFPVSVLLRFLNLFIPIKLAPIRSNVLGHFVIHTEYHLRRIQLKPSPNRLICFFNNGISNTQWEKMVRRRYFVNWFFQYVWIANRLIPGFKRYEFELVDGEGDIRDQYGIVSRTQPQLTFDYQENIRGKSYLVDKGISDREKFICLIVRDSGYKESLNEGIDRTYHSYRNSVLDSYKEAVIALSDRGYWIFRMGKGVKENFDISYPRVIDYATSDDRSDFLDIWLTANCYFCVTTGTGLDEVAGFWGIPSVFVNLLPLNHIPLYKNSITVPKKLIWEENGKLLSLEEYMRHGYTSTDEYRDQGIRITDLNSHEICEVIGEMELTLRGEYEQTGLQVARQEQSIKTILDCDKQNAEKFELDSRHPTRGHQYYQDPQARIGSYFLNKYWCDLFPKNR